MFHSERTWCVAQVETAPELADKLTEHSWCNCTAFELRGYLFLCDQTSPDGAGEWAIVRRPERDDEPFLQVESVTFSWCDQSEALQYVLEAIGGDMANSGDNYEVHPDLETPEEHGTCPHCA